MKVTNTPRDLWICRRSLIVADFFLTTTRAPFSSWNVQEILPATTWNARTRPDNKRDEGRPGIQTQTLPRIWQAEHGRRGSSSSRFRSRICVSLLPRKSPSIPLAHHQAPPPPPPRWESCVLLAKCRCCCVWTIARCLLGFQLSCTSSRAWWASWRRPY